jgi:hypothetical protein
LRGVWIGQLPAAPGSRANVGLTEPLRLGLGLVGQTINPMTLAGIAAALGLIADDAIVVIENVHRHTEERISPDPASSGLAEILPALIGSSSPRSSSSFPSRFSPAWPSSSRSRSPWRRGTRRGSGSS